jgi:hypothetical protein
VCHVFCVCALPPLLHACYMPLLHIATRPHAGSQANLFSAYTSAASKTRSLPSASARPAAASSQDEEGGQETELAKQGLAQLIAAAGGWRP